MTNVSDSPSFMTQAKRLLPWAAIFGAVLGGVIAWAQTDTRAVDLEKQVADVRQAQEREHAEVRSDQQHLHEEIQWEREHVIDQLTKMNQDIADIKMTQIRICSSNKIKCQ